MLLCPSGDASSDPIFKDYDGKQVKVEWTARAGCEVTGGEDPGKGGGGNDQEDAEHVGSGVGWFFLV
jgi:autophagy-related protein 27